MINIKKNLYVRILAFLIVWNTAGYAQTSAHNPVVLTWKINDTVRKALVYIPPSAKTRPTPLIFAFHGHSGSMNNMYRTHRFDLLWPEAMIVYPQGLNTPGKIVDPEGKASGWQTAHSMGDRDLIFFDAMLASLKKEYYIDPNRIYATGHSNGGNFVYLLWAQRGAIFAAMAPTATTPGKNIRALQPKPVFHLTGENDPIVKPELQYLTHKKLISLNKCNPQGKKTGAFTTIYQSSINMPVELYIHPGGHEYPQAANEAIVSFFESQEKR